MELYLIFRRIKMYTWLSFFLLSFHSNESHSQCSYSPIIAISYYHENCGDNSMQNLTGVLIPVYGSYNGIQLTSPLTNNVVITSSEEEKFPEFKIYPNPTFDHINIKWTQTINANIFIYSQVGSLISKSFVNANTISTLDVQNLLPGYYIVKAVTDNNLVFISKLIKQ